jgi:uncharacterized metal-binding protein YceD (DUF177 family)
VKLDTPLGEFSRKISLQRLPARGARYEIAADEGERAALAKRFHLLALDRLVAEVELRRRGEDYRLEAAFEAQVVQECVATLEPVTNQIAERFCLLYQREGGGEASGGRAGLDLSAEDEDIEPLRGEEIDIGEAVAQQLSLAIDPFPRLPGAAIAAEAADPPNQPPDPGATKVAEKPIKE